MASKSSSPGPNAAPTKQTKARKGSPPTQADQSKAGSTGDAMAPKKTVARGQASSPKKVAPSTTATAPASDDTTAAGAKTAKRKPRKLNKNPTPPKSPTLTKVPSESLSNSELEALKARVRGLEAKMEELYKNSAILDSRAGRSPRRRGKGRKGTSSEQLSRVNTAESDPGASPQMQSIAGDGEEADEELVRLEGELEVARHDLEHYRPKKRRTRSDETDYVEEIPRGSTATAGSGDRQVTLSGSYRIPIPASVNIEDVQTLKSGVSAAQNLARSFFEQRRAAAAAPDAQPSPRPSSATPTKVPASKTRPKRSVNSNIEVAVDNSGGKQSWSDWIGGYSMAISRAVSKIEHEAAVEAQRSGARRMSVPSSKKAQGRRPGVKPTLSAEQVHRLMS